MFANLELHLKSIHFSVDAFQILLLLAKHQATDEEALTTFYPPWPPVPE